MTTTYAANGSVVHPTVGSGGRFAITATTDTTPIQVTCTGHPFNTGDTIEQEGLQVTPANGIFQITKVDANTYSLNGTTAPGGAGGSGGYATDYELLPAIKIPAGGELADPGVVGAALEGLCNPAPFLYRAAGKYRCVQEYGGVLAVGTYPYRSNPWVTHNTFTSVTPVLFTDMKKTFLEMSDAPSGPAPSFKSSDLLEITTTFTPLTLPDAGSASSYVNYGVALSDGSSIYTGPYVPWTTVRALTEAVGAPLVPITLTTLISLSLTSFTFPMATLAFGIWAQVDSLGAGASSVSFSMFDSWSALIRQLRLN